MHAKKKKKKSDFFFFPLLLELGWLQLKKVDVLALRQTTYCKKYSSTGLWKWNHKKVIACFSWRDLGLVRLPCRPRGHCKQHTPDGSSAKSLCKKILWTLVSIVRLSVSPARKIRRKGCSTVAPVDLCSAQVWKTSQFGLICISSAVPAYTSRGDSSSSVTPLSANPRLVVS